MPGMQEQSRLRKDWITPVWIIRKRTARTVAGTARIEDTATAEAKKDTSETETETDAPASRSTPLTGISRPGTRRRVTATGLMEGNLIAGNPTEGSLRPTADRLPEDTAVTAQRAALKTAPRTASGRMPMHA